MEAESPARHVAGVVARNGCGSAGVAASMNVCAVTLILILIA